MGKGNNIQKSKQQDVKEMSGKLKKKKKRMISLKWTTRAGQNGVGQNISEQT